MTTSYPASRTGTFNNKPILPAKLIAVQDRQDRPLLRSGHSLNHVMKMRRRHAFNSDVRYYMDKVVTDLKGDISELMHHVPITIRELDPQWLHPPSAGTEGEASEALPPQPPNTSPNSRRRRREPSMRRVQTQSAAATSTDNPLSEGEQVPPHSAPSGPLVGEARTTDDILDTWRRLSTSVPSMDALPAVMSATAPELTLLNGGSAPNLPPLQAIPPAQPVPAPAGTTTERRADTAGTAQGAADISATARAEKRARAMRAKVASELKALGDVPPGAPNRLTVYRNLFADIIVQLNTFGPLLADVKREYDTALKSYEASRLDIEHLRAQLAAVTRDEAEHVEIARLQDMVKILTKENTHLKEDVTKGKRENERLEQIITKRANHDGDISPTTAYALLTEQKEAAVYRKLYEEEKKDKKRNFYPIAHKNLLEEKINTLQAELDAAQAQLEGNHDILSPHDRSLRTPRSSKPTSPRTGLTRAASILQRQRTRTDLVMTLPTLATSMLDSSRQLAESTGGSHH